MILIRFIYANISLILEITYLIFLMTNIDLMFSTNFHHTENNPTVLDSNSWAKVSKRSTLDELSYSRNGFLH